MRITIGITDVKRITALLDWVFKALTIKCSFSCFRLYGIDISASCNLYLSYIYFPTCMSYLQLEAYSYRYPYLELPAYGRHICLYKLICYICKLTYRPTYRRDCWWMSYLAMVGSTWYPPAHRVNDSIKDPACVCQMFMSPVRTWMRTSLARWRAELFKWPSSN